jgi:hypothetical protein
MRIKVLGIALVMALTCFGQDAKAPRASPHDKVTLKLGTTTITMEYGRPFLKGRHVGAEVAPYGEVWRTGADEATTLVTDGDIMLGTLKVPKGKYTVFTLPTKTGWTLIVNKIPEQWGAFNYAQDRDLGRIPMTVKTVKAPVEQFTMTLIKAAKRATLKMAWDTTEASIQVSLT